MKYKPIEVGDKYGRWTVLKPIKLGRQAKWLCKCECGTEKIVPAQNLKTGKSKSCGCLNRELASIRLHNIAFKHGSFPQKLYVAWQNMKLRCTSLDKSGRYYKRGIFVCDEWKNSFLAFREWALKNGYQENLTIDRIDVNGNYEPSNCRWITMKEQSNNRSTNHFVEFNGETHTIAEWSNILNVSYGKVKYRVHKQRSLSDLIEV